jgi:NADPH:quinone reductase
MKAAFFRATGSPDVIQFGDLPEPSCGPDQCKVEVKAVSVNPIDTYIRNGANYWKLPDPYIVGSDFAGTVIEVGANVKNIEMGERVWASNQGLMGRQGCFAEVVSVDAKWLHPTPEGIDDTDVAAIALVAITAHIGLFRRAHLQANETIFVRGGTGGVGAMVVQMAKAVGAKVLTTAGSDLKVQQCRDLGADHAFNYNQSNLAEEIQRAAPNGVQVFWETLRDPDFDLAVGALGENGRMVLMAGRDARPTFPVGPFYVKGCSLHGFAMFKSPAEDQMTTASDINHWLSTGQLKAQIDRILPLSQTAEAHRLQESHTIQKQSSLSGKLVLRTD